MERLGANMVIDVIEFSTNQKLVKFFRFRGFLDYDEGFVDETFALCSGNFSNRVSTNQSSPLID